VNSVNDLFDAPLKRRKRLPTAVAATLVAFVLLMICWALCV
jgi:hypothetical protein